MSITLRLIFTLTIVILSVGSAPDRDHPNGTGSHLELATSARILLAINEPAGLDLHNPGGAVPISRANSEIVSMSGVNHPTSPLAPDAQIMVGAGDIASCGSQKDEETAALLDTIPGMVFTLGDNAYPDGTKAQFDDCYDPTWGRQKTRTRPAAGNHDYHTSGASGYFNYFGTAAGNPGEGYYSYDVGDWHVIVLNSECSDIGGCNLESPQGKWLKADLAAHPSACTLAYWHKPLFSSDAKHGNYSKVQDFWSLLYVAGADLVLNGHAHTYERFAPQDPNGNPDPEHGIREFVVGTGGASLYSFGTIQPNSEVRNSDTHGVLKLTLSSGSYSWEFVPISGETFTDSGSGTCVGPSGADHAPVAVDDVYWANKGTQLSVAAPGVLGNDSDLDGDALTAHLVNDVSHGTLTLSSDGSFEYVPQANFEGEDSFTYMANDGALDSGPASVRIGVNTAISIYLPWVARTFHP